MLYFGVEAATGIAGASICRTFRRPHKLGRELQTNQRLMQVSCRLQLPGVNTVHPRRHRKVQTFASRYEYGGLSGTIVSTMHCAAIIFSVLSILNLSFSRHLSRHSRPTPRPRNILISPEHPWTPLLPSRQWDCSSLWASTRKMSLK